MNRGQGGKSILTSSNTLLLYYVCALLTVVTGFTFLVAAAGAVVSRSVAHKEGVPFVIAHCTWLFRSIWVTALLSALVFFGALHMMGEDFSQLPSTAHITNFEQLWADPTLRQAVQYALTFVCLGGGILLWFVYRMLRGMFMLIQSNVPVQR